MHFSLNKKILAIIFIIFLFDLTGMSQCPPEILYYRFKDNTNSSTPNFGIPGAGNQMAVVTGHNLGSGGQFDSCLIGIGGVNNYVNTGWATNLGTGNWTLSFWVNNLVDNNPTYLFGDATAGNLRCFYGGAAGSNNILLRGPFIDVTIQNVMPGPTVIYMVYDGLNIKIYRNGVLQSTNLRPCIILTGSGPFQVGGMENHNCLNQGGMMDEFRLYNRALSSSEVAASWNVELNCLTGIEPNKSIPQKFELSQNYPNPFNPVTIIKYGIPKQSPVKVVVYDETGKEISVLVNDVQPAGNYKIEFDGTNLSSGVYFYKIVAGDFVSTKKMSLVK